MNRLHHHPHQRTWSYLFILLAALAVLAGVRPAQATANIWLVKDINKATSQSYLNYLTAIGNTIYFATDDGVHGYELWRSNGTEAGTSLVKDINPTSESTPSDLTAVGNTIYFAANDGVYGGELWKSDGTTAGTTMVKDIVPTGSSNLASLTAAGNLLFFTAGLHESNLWKSDGTAAGTTQLTNLVSGMNSIYPSNLTAVSNTLFFRADDGARGDSLWKSDGPSRALP
jgi:ELWxxDGT repeat protein